MMKKCKICNIEFNDSFGIGYCNDCSYCSRCHVKNKLRDLECIQCPHGIVSFEMEIIKKQILINQKYNEIFNLKREIQEIESQNKIKKEEMFYE